MTCVFLVAFSAFAVADEKFIAKVGIPHIDQFMATSLIEDGHCVPGVTFASKKGGFGIKSLARILESRLNELKANAWVLIDYREAGLIPTVWEVQVLPLQCTIEIVPPKVIES